MQLTAKLLKIASFKVKCFHACMSHFWCPIINPCYVERTLRKISCFKNTQTIDDLYSQTGTGAVPGVVKDVSVSC